MSKRLSITVYSEEKRLVFSGDTFLYKDQIKSLGKSFWNSAEKNWQVKDCAYSHAELLALFPYADIIGLTESKTSELHSDSTETILNKELELEASSVSAFFILVKRAINLHFKNTIKIYGIINSYKRITNGRLYFDLLDSITHNASIRCVLWESNLKVLKDLKDKGIELEENLPVLIEASVAFNSKNGQVSLSVEAFIPEYTLGKIQALREQTNERLKKEGLFSQNKELKLPFLPIRLGILTSDAGTVINDFKASLEVCNFGFKLFWYPTRVQGEYAVSDLIKGISYFTTKMSVDAILIFRGGGSVTELSVFSAYELSKAVCSSPLPILSAIGHEYDQSSVQDVSYKSFGVPKDIGRFFSDVILSRKEDLSDFGENLVYESFQRIQLAEKNLSSLTFKSYRQFKSLFENRFKALERAGKTLESLAKLHLDRSQKNLLKMTSQIKASFQRKFDESSFNLAKQIDMLYRRFDAQLGSASLTLKRFEGLMKLAQDYSEGISLKLKLLEGGINNYSPKIQLERGFAIVRNVAERKIVMSVEELKPLEHISIEMADGIREFKVKGDEE